MADPLSTVAAVAVAIDSVRKTKQFIEAIDGAPAVVTALAGDVQALEDSLGTLSGLVTDAQRTFGTEDTEAIAVYEEMARSVAPSLRQCEQAVGAVVAMLQPFVEQTDGSTAQSVWKDMSANFKEHEIVALRTQLESSKSSLVLANQQATLLLQTHESGQQRKQDKEEGHEVEASHSNSRAESPPHGASSGDAPLSGDHSGDANNDESTASFFDSLRQSPQFQELRRIVQKQPTLFEPVLQQLTKNNPQLSQFIAQNPDRFLEVFTEGQDQEPAP